MSRRRGVAALLACLVIPGAALSQQPSIESAAQLLRRGENEYHAGRYGSAADTLTAAISGLLSDAAQERYIKEGELADLPQIEESLVYLALAETKLGRDNEARDAVLRLLNAERIAPTYANLPLARDRSDFEAVAGRLVAGANLQRAGAAVPAVIASTEAERAVMFRLVEVRAAEQRAEIERQAAARVAEARKLADERVAAQTGDVNRDADTKIAAAHPTVVARAPSVTADALRARYDEMARQFAAKSGGRYTVQLEIACETASITKALRDGATAIWFVPITYRGRRCYRVFWGHFATPGEAQRAVTTIPAPLRGSTAAVVVREP